MLVAMPDQTDPVPSMSFVLVPSTAHGFPVENNDVYRDVISQAVSGGKGTAGYLQHLLSLSDLVSYLHRTGPAAFIQESLPNGSVQSRATDGHATMNVVVQLNDGLAETDLNGIPVRGVATVRLALPAPNDVAKIISFGLSLAELPAGIVVTNILIQSLFKPLLQQLVSYVQNTVVRWLDVDVGEDIAELGDDLADAAADAAEEVGAETAELVVEEVAVAEVAIDLSAAVPAFAVLALLAAVPLLIIELSKQFLLHLEIDNVTDYDITWSQPYIYNGAMTAEPKDQVLPKMGRAVDAWGDETDVPVVYQANFSSMNKSGYKGTGVALKLSPNGLTGQDVAVLISIPWGADNALWMGEVTPGMDWEQAFDDYPEPVLHTTHGNQKLYLSLGIDALTGNSDSYHCVLRINPL
jgi:hypothetical protein